MTEMGGIYNRALFKSAKTRPALNKLSKMGGISSLNKDRTRFAWSIRFRDLYLGAANDGPLLLL